MRTEQEIRNRIYELEEVIKIAITRYYRKDDNEEIFYRTYSSLWDKMKTLYWILGKSSVEATTCVALKVMRMSDEIRATIKNQQ